MNSLVKGIIENQKNLWTDTYKFNEMTKLVALSVVIHSTVSAVIYERASQSFLGQAAMVGALIVPFIFSKGNFSRALRYTALIESSIAINDYLNTSHIGSWKLCAMVIAGTYLYASYTVEKQKK
jgi:hypothetical protein